jgi:endoglucanase
LLHRDGQLAKSSAFVHVEKEPHPYAFEVHQYLDGDSSGQSDTCVSNTIGSERLQGFTSWLKANNKRGFLGELGGGRNNTCYAALDDMVAHLQKNGDVWLGWTYWAAGPWWGDYIYTLEPSNGQDRPQLAPLLKHLP